MAERAGLDYPALFEQGPAACMVLDQDLAIVTATDAFLRATMSTRAGIVGRSAFDAFPSPGGNQPAAFQAAIRETLQRVQREGTPETLPVHRYDVPADDGGSVVRYWRTEIMPLPGEPPRPGWLLVRQEDVTRGERALYERTCELEASNRELEQFAYVASHDLQEPLRKVSSFCQLLADQYQGRLDEEGEEYIGFAVDGANRMQQLINDLLTLSRVGRTEEARSAVDCNQVIDRVQQDLALAIEETGAEIVVAGPLPSVRAQAAEQVQLFSNLVANAIKFHGDEPPRIGISAVRDNGGWRFAVADNGIGIDAEYADRIFGVFQRLHSRSRYPGTGIGLSVCKKIVESNGGQIWLESKPGAGSTFRWTYPAGDGGQ